MEWKVVIRLFISGILCHTCLAAEPRGCSQFSYEVSTLERMIKSEIRVEEIGQDVQKAEERIKHAEQSVAILIEELKLQSTDMEKTFRDKETKIEEMRENMEKQKNKMESELKDLAATPVVVFQATGIDDSTPSTNQILVFPTTVVNDGHGYDNATGYFTAPVAGMYHITVQLCVHPGKRMYFNMVVDNDNIKSAVFYGASNTYPCHSADIGITMRKDMKAWVRCSGGSNVQLYQDSYRTITFSGYLVYRLPQQ